MKAWKDLAGRMLARPQPETAASAQAAAGTRVLMVCMGNICRSPTAEAVLRAKLERAGLGGQVWVDSAGTHGYHTGEAPDPRAIRHAAQRGYDLSALRARAVDESDFSRFDWILAMDQANFDWLRRRAPGDSPARIELLLAANAIDHEVPDPYFGPPAGFDRVLDLVEAGCDAWLARLAPASTSLG